MFDELNEAFQYLPENIKNDGTCDSRWKEMGNRNGLNIIFNHQTGAIEKIEILRKEKMVNLKTFGNNFARLPGNNLKPFIDKKDLTEQDVVLRIDKFTNQEKTKNNKIYTNGILFLEEFKNNFEKQMKDINMFFQKGNTDIIIYGENLENISKNLDKNTINTLVSAISIFLKENPADNDSIIKIISEKFPFYISFDNFDSTTITNQEEMNKCFKSQSKIDLKNNYPKITTSYGNLSMGSFFDNDSGFNIRYGKSGIEAMNVPENKIFNAKVSLEYLSNNDKTCQYFNQGEKYFLLIAYPEINYSNINEFASFFGQDDNDENNFLEKSESFFKQFEIKEINNDFNIKLLILNKNGGKSSPNWSVDINKNLKFYDLKNNVSEFISLFNKFKKHECKYVPTPEKLWKDLIIIHSLNLNQLSENDYNLENKIIKNNATIKYFDAFDAILLKDIDKAKRFLKIIINRPQRLFYNYKSEQKKQKRILENNAFLMYLLWSNIKKGENIMESQFFQLGQYFKYCDKLHELYAECVIKHSLGRYIGNESITVAFNNPLYAFNQANKRIINPYSSWVKNGKPKNNSKNKDVTGLAYYFNNQLEKISSKIKDVSILDKKPSTIECAELSLGYFFCDKDSSTEVVSPLDDTARKDD